MHNLDSWINPKYVDLYKQGRLGELRAESPFRHAVLKDFLKPEAFKSILDHSKNIPVEPSHRKGVAAYTDWYWGAFSHLDYIRFFLSREMRAFLNELIGQQLVLKKKHIPQFNIFRAQSRGLPIHTDMAENVGVVTLMQLSDGYEPGLGGELEFFERVQGSFKNVKRVEPIGNTLILFQVSEKSFHGVADMKGTWTRSTITYDWLYEGQAAQQLKQNL